LVFVVLRYSVSTVGFAEFLVEARSAIEALSARPGFIRGTVGQAIDEAGQMTVLLEFSDVGTYRRALSNYDVKINAVPLLSRAIDEPSAFELLHSRNREGSVDEQSSISADGTRFPVRPS
jgi:hypothetical protein